MLYVLTGKGSGSALLSHRLETARLSFRAGCTLRRRALDATTAQTAQPSRRFCSQQPGTGTGRHHRPSGGRRRCSTAAGSSPEAEPGSQQPPTLLLDLLLPAAPAKVCAAVFGPGSTGSHAGSAGSHGGSGDACGLLLRFLEEELGCTGMTAEAWGSYSSSSSSSGSSAGAWQRRLSYSTPLTLKQRLLLPLGPPAVPNAERQRVTAASDGSGGITVRCSVASSGVPFADCFRNELEWRLEAAAADGSGGTRVRLSAACVFHRPVVGPLRGQIEGESLRVRRAARDRCRPAPISRALPMPAIAALCDWCWAAGRMPTRQLSCLPTAMAQPRRACLASMPASPACCSSTSAAAAATAAAALAPAAPAWATRRVPAA